MDLELNGKTYWLRCDMRALANAKREHKTDLSDITESYKDENGKKQERENFDAIGCLVYHFAKSGAKFKKQRFPYEMDDFLGLIQLEDISKLGDALQSLMGGGTEKKS